MLKKENKKRLMGVLLIIVLVSYFIKDKIRLVTEVTSSIFNPIQAKIYSTSTDIKNTTSLAVNFSEMKVIMAEDKEKIILLEAELNEYRALKEENERLQQLLNLKREDINYIAAKVIFRHIYELYEVFTINKGKNQGLKKDMVIVLGDKLIGKIEKVEDEFSIVRTINSPELRVSVIDGKGNLGIIQGGEDASREVIYTPSVYNENISVGEKIYTSGISDIYPKGLLIGEIKEKSKEDDSFIVTTVLDSSKLEEVIVRDRGGK